MNATTHPEHDVPDDIEFEVQDWPPTKAEAKSLLAAGHPHAQRVRSLLEAARDAIRRTGWTVTASDIALELVIRSPGRPPSDATNYLGGVGDVLQVKATGRNIDVTHLGYLAAVALYADDRQIRQLQYAETRAATRPSYTVRIHVIDT